MEASSGLIIDTVSRERQRSAIASFFIRMVKEKPLGTIGGVIIILLLFTGIFADFLAPYGYAEMVIRDRLKPWSAEHLLGTDQVGRDLFSRIIYGARISMIVSIAGASLSVLLATIIGVISGFLGGKFDLAVQRFVDGWLCFPPLFLMLSIMAILGPGLLQVIIVLGALRGISNSRVVRSAVIGIKENLYIYAARVTGAPTWLILFRHILPNVMPPIIIIFTLSLGTMIISEATLSFLGFGVPPPMPSWGGMLSGAGRAFIYEAPWLAIWPGLALSLVVFGINMLGDAVRDLLDPRLRGGRLGHY
jgi:peptide/nickel transport system permease protein